METCCASTIKTGGTCSEGAAPRRVSPAYQFDGRRRRDEPGQAREQPVLEGAATEDALLGELERDDPAGVIDRPVVDAAVPGDGGS